jgi:predicted dithiol-disulfide oxidoreductase (DUF899 family)
MKDVSKHLGPPAAATNAPSLPAAVDRETWQEQIAALRLREKAHTRAGDAIAAARRRLPMVEVDAATPVVGAHGEAPLIDTFEGRLQLFASYHIWHTGRPAADQCEGCTFNTGHVLELSYLHSRDVTFAVFCEGPFDASKPGISSTRPICSMVAPSIRWRTGCGSSRNVALAR